MIYRNHLKRLVDVLVSIISMFSFLPIMLITALAVRLEDAGPALFRQRRIGRFGEGFGILKFRSMALDVGDLPSASASNLMITHVGRFIRRTNLDELPQLLNILKGDMSLVGPRPALPTQFALTNIRQGNGALECRPGLTGLAQVSAYDGMPDEEKARWDGEYASNITFIGDLKIILRTFTYLARRPPTY